MKTSENINEITKAMSELQGKLQTLAKSEKAYNYKYTTLATIWESFRPYLVELGLFIFQDVVTVEQGVQCLTRINHISGQWVETDYLLIPMGKRDPHSAGSAASYARRYSLSAALGIVTGEEDDDGGKAMQAGPAKAKPQVYPMDEGEIDAWFEKWSRKYDPQDIQAYCEARAKHLGHKMGQTCAELKADEAMFVKNIGIWLKQKEKEEE